ncbi:MAG TPA: hypothetical protein VMR31_00170 [Myxococcota bacterium]|nr:hypothetical protein [Myxococcota bacterium]
MKRLALFVAAVLFARPSSGAAASIDLTVALVPGTSHWLLQVDSQSASPVGAIDLVVSDSLGNFVPAVQLPPVYCVQADGAGCLPSSTGTHSFSLAIPLSIYPVQLQALAGPFGHAVLGYFDAFTSSPAHVQVSADPALGGYSVFDTNAAPILDVAIHVVPEPRSAVPFALAAALLLAARLRAS